MSATTPDPAPATFETWFAAGHPQIPLAGATAVLRLAAEGATVPFMARYRKEQTGNLDELALQQVLDAHERWEHVRARQKFVLGEIERQKKLTPELRARILTTLDPDALEDLYLPFKQKRKSKANAAREAGLGPLADWIWNCAHGLDRPLEGQTLELWAYTFRNEERGYGDLEAVLQGAQELLTERLAETVELRQRVREALFSHGCLRSQKGVQAKPHSKFEKYFEHQEPVAGLLKPEASHRYLAMRRGQAEGELRLGLCGPKSDESFEERLCAAFEAEAACAAESPGAELLRRAARAALREHVWPSIESEVHRQLKQAADQAAIGVFAENLRRLLLASPFGSQAVLGVDPGLRTGCKLAVVDAGGRFLASDVLHLHTADGRDRARAVLAALLERVGVKAVAVGNGTAGRETETFLRGMLKELGCQAQVVMVSEAGASVYSASEAAREEFAHLDVTVRGAISIARRLQDPLAELVKIDPKSIGVGQYQHDVPGHALKKSLEQVVDSCVNQVGVDVNTASHHLLAHVAGIGSALAHAVVEHRTQHGLFRARPQLLEVRHFSRKTFEQAAGFLRIPGGENPLDNTGVHPERYPVLERLAERLGRRVEELLGEGVAQVKTAAEVREEVGPFTFDDMLRELEKPGRDPRTAFVPFAFREDVLALKDLLPGMECPGVVTNVTHFGAFVDVGVHHDGLVHVSQISDRFVKDPHEVVHPGQRVKVRVLAVDLDKQQIALTMKSAVAPRAPRPAHGAEPAPSGSPRRRQRPRRTPAGDGAARQAPGGSARVAPPPAAARSRAEHPPDQRRASGARRPRGPQRPASSDATAAGPLSAPLPTPRPAAAREERGAHRPGPGERPGTRPRPEVERRAPARQAPLNNPFAVLAGLKEELRRRGGK